MNLSYYVVFSFSILARATARGNVLHSLTGKLTSPSVTLQEGDRLGFGVGFFFFGVVLGTSMRGEFHPAL